MSRRQMLGAVARVAAVAIAVMTASAQEPTPRVASGGGARLNFKYDRPIVTHGSGPRRLVVDVPLVSGAMAFRVTSRTVDPTTGEIKAVATGGASDLRLLDAGGREIGYLFVLPPPSEPAWKQAQVLPIAPTATEREKTSGFEADFGQTRQMDRVRIRGLRPPFLKRARLEGSGDRSHWTLLAAEATVFDLPDERLQQLDLAFTPGPYRYLRVTWDDTRSGRLPLPAAVVARIVANAVEPAPLTTPLTFERRPNDPGISRFRLRLPAARLPIVALALDVGGGHLLRHVTVEEARVRGGEVVPVTIGDATIRRVVHDDVAAAELKVPIEPPNESVIDLLVQDGDNPPLELRAIAAVFATLPWIYFESDGTALNARYGNASVPAPKYDLEAARDSLKIDAVADAAWGEPRARSDEEAGTMAAPPLPTVGAAVDLSQFKFVRAVPPSAAGLVVLPLDAAALAHSAGEAGRFGDVRVVDASGRQVPYLIERSSGPLSLDIRIERTSNALAEAADRPGTRSVYRVRLPIENLPSSRLVIATSARVFQRRITIAVPRAADRRHRDSWLDTVTSATWVHSDQDRPTPELTIRLGPLDAGELLAIVDEGDNSALPITAARLLLPAFRLRFYRERDASLRLAYGRSDLAPPRYDLALLAPQLLGVTATELSAAAEESGSAAVASTATAKLSGRIFWFVLAASVVVILALIARLLAKPGAV